MSEILISINPDFVQKIISGEKRFEFRTRVAKKKAQKIIIYCTSPIKKVLAEAEIKDILALSPEELWARTSPYAGISKERFFKYFSGHKIAYAYELGKVTSYATGKSLSEFGCKSAPQSFVYVRL
jgi:predicted transcriptional regulator